MSETFTLKFCGAADTVTGSRHLVDVGGERILLDCGLFQGFKALRSRNWASFPVVPRTITAVVLSHAHLDHSGYLPALAKNGFRGPVYCSHATRDLAELVLLDSAHLMEEEARHANDNRYSRHAPALPLYTVADVQNCMKQFKPKQWDTPIAQGEVEIELTPAGHLLGAACVRLRHGGRSLVFSGDLGREHDLLMHPPAPIDSADILLVESTYGNREHPPEDVEEKLAEVIRSTAAKGGTCLVPTFALGRAQALMVMLYRLKMAERIPDMPVFLDSPMALKATQLYAQHVHQLRVSETEFGHAMDWMRFVASPDESRALSSVQVPSVILAGSGMATGGRILHHLKNYVSDPRASIIFPGFQVPGTRGARLLAGEKTIRIHGQDLAVRAKVSHYEGFSGHADANEIMYWLDRFARTPAHCFVVHGEREAADALRLRIEKEKHWNVSTVDQLQSVQA
jgi:metallo-beta-lactamase family protein